MEEGGVERKREEIRRKLEEKRREMLEREGEVVAERQQGQDESHIRKILKIEPYGPFKKGEKKPVPIEISEIGLKGDINEVKLSDALKEAEKMKKDGLSGDTIVSLRLPEKHGGLGREKQTTLKKLLQPKTREKLRKDFAGGGVIILGGEEKVSETSSALGLKSEQAASTLLKLAGIIAEKSEEEPGKMRGEYAKSVASILDAVKSLIMGSGEESTTAGFLGGDAEGRKPLRAFKGPTWYQLDETSKLAAVWWMENVKFRGQYA